MTNDTVRTGGCACGEVRFEVRGEPVRTGLCHCMTCRQTTGSAFLPFAVFPADRVSFTGDVREWRASPGYARCFCATCGSRVFGRDEAEYDISFGALDRPGEFAPHYELWTLRREPWMPDVGEEIYETSRTA